MKLLILGDSHGDLNSIDSAISACKKNHIDTIIQVGDFGYGWEPPGNGFIEGVNKRCVTAEIDFYWLDGNHENFDRLEEAVDTTADCPQSMFSNVTYLPRGCTWTWDGCRFMALGGAFSIDKEYRVQGKSWWPQELITTAEVERAMANGEDGVDVMLTHDAPQDFCPIVSSYYKDDHISRGNRMAVSAVMEHVKPKLLVHGHFHYRYTNRVTQPGLIVEGLDRDGQGSAQRLIIDTEDWKR